jgi:hypothetical protein
MTNPNPNTQRTYSGRIVSLPISAILKGREPKRRIALAIDDQIRTIRRVLMHMRPLIATIGCIVALVVFLGLTLLIPDVDPLQDYLSAYFDGEFGSAASLAFVAQGIAWATLARAIVQLDVRPTLGLILLYLSALAAVIIGINPTGPSIRPPTLQETIDHWARLTIFVAGGLAPLLLTLKLRSLPPLEPVARPLLILATLVLGVGALGFLTTAWVGAVQRIHTLVMNAWIVWVSWRLRERQPVNEE